MITMPTVYRDKYGDMIQERTLIKSQSNHLKHFGKFNKCKN
jgi:hypothetical protein